MSICASTVEMSLPVFQRAELVLSEWNRTPAVMNDRFWPIHMDDESRSSRRVQ